MKYFGSNSFLGTELKTSIWLLCPLKCNGPSLSWPKKRWGLVQMFFTGPLLHADKEYGIAESEMFITF